MAGPLYTLHWVPLPLSPGKEFIQIYVCSESVFNIFFNVYLFWERERMSAGKAKRETENPKQAPRYQSRVQGGAWSHKLWDHDMNQNQESDV